MIRIFAVFVVLAASPTPASADPIVITHGQVAVHGPSDGGTIVLAGDGFAFDGRTGTGWLGIFTSCLPCLPGDAITLNAGWVGSDLRGTATVDGYTYENVGNMTSLNSGSISLTTDHVIVPLDGLVATLLVPFTLTGMFWLHDPFVVAEIFGRGVVAAQIERPDLYTPWTSRGISTYDFQEMSPVPEPATMVLVGTALGGLALRQYRRRRTAQRFRREQKDGR